MNKKLIAVVLVCVSTLTASTGYYIYTLKEYVSKLETLSQSKQEHIDINEQIINYQEETISNKQAKIDDLKILIGKLEWENSEYVQQLNELSIEVDKAYAQTYFDNSDVTKPSNATVAHMRRALEGTSLYELSSAYIEAEEMYGVNAYFIAAITGLESSWGTSNRAENSNNLSGFAVYNNTAEGRTFESKEHCVLETAKLLSEEYLNEDGKYYNGVSAKAVNTKYCFLPDSSETDYTWYQKVTSIAIGLKNKANDF